MAKALAKYKNAAIKKRTAFSSDPTHGNGGMNLYYKTHGKQARQKAQRTSVVGGEDNPTQAQPDGAVAQTKPATQTDQPSAASSLPKSGTAPTTATPATGNAQVAGNAPTDATGSTKLRPSAISANSDTVPTQTHATPAAQPAAPTVPSAPTESPIVKLSVEFARSKSWRDAPYGDWTNDKGEQIAVTGLDGQVVPIRFVDREELKSFAEKRMVDGANLREEFQRICRK